MNTALTFEELFDPDFLNSLSHLSITARRVAAGGRFGEKLSRDQGTGLEFKDFRAYAPGDDLRRVDWNIYRRLGRVFLRLYEEQQDLPLYLMPDLSESMYFNDAARAKSALKSALAMATISMNQNDSAGLVPFGGDVEVITRGKSGKASIIGFARRLSTLTPQPKTDLVRSLGKLASLNLRPGLLVIISDFFDASGMDAIGRAMGKIRHKILLIQIVRKSDGEPTLEGELRVRDCETGQTADIAVTPSVLKRYKATYGRFNNELAAISKKRRAGLLQLDADEDVTDQLAELFVSGSFSV